MSSPRSLNTQINLSLREKERRKGLTVVVCKSENVQKKVPHTTYQLTGKIAWKEDIERKRGNEDKSLSCTNFTLKLFETIQYKEEAF